MAAPVIYLSSLRKALGWPSEALMQKPHLRSALIQSLGFSHERSLRRLRRVLIERAGAAAPYSDLDMRFNDPASLS